jgi:anti-sigma factor RsiW
MRCDDVLELQSALLDGELGARDSRDVQAHLATCTACQAALEEKQDLSESLRGGAEYYRASVALRSRITAQIGAASATAMRKAKPARRTSSFSLTSWWPSWGGAMAAPMAAALVAFTVGAQFAGPSAADRLLEEAVGDHARALLTDHAFDVASSDQHTVKPWFADKLDFSPPVHDLAATGFPLIGGRLDYLDHRRVAVLAYRKGQHEIDVFVWPGDRGDSAVSSPVRTSRGYNVVRWSENGMNFFAVSDVATQDLQQLMALMRAPSTS